MASPYSYDLRRKAINAVRSGEKKVSVCRMFSISRNTLDLWLKREQQTGDFQAISNYQKGKRPKIKNFQGFQEFVLQHNSKTQQRIAQLWGDNLTQQNVSDALKKLGITRKKNLWVSRKR
jgi:transposase